GRPLSSVEGAISEQPAVTAASSGPAANAPDTAAAASPDPATVMPASAPSPAAGPEPADPTDAAMTRTRRQLDLIDQMLGAAPK
ncbi:chemotaxis protein MotC, partial [Mesorhizobium sp. M7A.T.Ca.US.000.02.1.1]